MKYSRPFKTFYYVESKKTDPKKIFEKMKNSWLFSEGNKYFLKSIYMNKKVEIDIIAKPLYFDDYLYKCLSKNLINAKKDIITISEIGIGNEIKTGNMFSSIGSEINKSFNERPKTLFHFLASIFIKLLMGHYLSNGNKRLSLLFLIYSLKSFGFYFFWTEGTFKNYKYYEEYLEKIVIKMQNQNINYNSIDEIAVWIESKTVISTDINYW